MNILPFVLTILMLMGLAGVTLFKGAGSSGLESRCIQGYICAQRQLQSERAFKKFKKLGAERDGQNKGEPRPHTPLKGPYISHRDDPNLKESSKFVLHTTHQSLYEPAARLLKLLYGHAPFYKDGLEYEILDEILWQKERKSLTDPFPLKEPLKTIYYKMLKGTNMYDLKGKKGIPPLTDFFTLGSGKISFYHASHPVLTALLGEDLTQKVMAAEKTASEKQGTKVSMGRKTFNELLTHQRINLEFGDASSIFYFSHSAEGVPVSKIDTATGVSARH